MKTGKEVAALIRMELSMEWRTLHSLGGILVYLVSSVFILYTTFLFISDPVVWNALLWIIILFISVNATAKSFLQEPEGRWLFMYQLCGPRALILGRTLYHAALLLILSFTIYGLFSFLLGNPVKDIGIYLLILFLGSFGFAAVFTLMSAIASRAGQNATLMAILGFPVVLPLLVTVLKLSSACLDGSLAGPQLSVISVLVLLDLLILSLSLVLFPYLWTE